MKWPFVSREMYDILRSDTSAQIGALTTELTTLRAEHKDLLAKYIDLATPKVTILTPKPKDLVSEAITTRAGMNGQLRAHLGTYARTCRADNLDDEAIIAAITHWKSNDDDGVE